MTYTHTHARTIRNTPTSPRTDTFPNNTRTPLCRQLQKPTTYQHLDTHSQWMTPCTQMVSREHTQIHTFIDSGHTFRSRHSLTDSIHAPKLSQRAPLLHTDSLQIITSTLGQRPCSHTVTSSQVVLMSISSKTTVSCPHTPSQMPGYVPTHPPNNTHGPNSMIIATCSDTDTPSQTAALLDIDTVFG